MLKFLSTRFIRPLMRRYLSKERGYSYRNITLNVFPGVFHPAFFFSTKFLLHFMEQFDLKGKKTPEGKILSSTQDVTSYLLHDCGMAIVPFYAFGSSHDSTWYRLSVGTCKLNEIEESISKLRKGLERLK